MRCTHCGAIIPDDQVVCPECGAEVQIVPDYNPLDDVLAREVKGSVEGATRQIQTDDIRRYRRDDRTKNVNSTRVLSPEERSRIRDKRRTGGQRKNTSEVRGQRRNTDELRRQKQNTDEQRRVRQQKRLEAAKRKRRNLLITLFLLLALIIAGIYLVYQNSYTSMINKGYRAIQSGDYDQAENYFDRAVRKDRSRPDAYTGYAEMYIDQDDLESAEDVFLTAIETQPTNAQLYEAAIAFYMDTEQPEKVSALLEDCEDENVLSSVSEYISSAPVFSPEAGTYNEVQEVTITSDTGGDIYYTTDGSDPTAETGTKYEEPILLQTEGDTEIRAIAVNAAGIPSIVSSASYKIEFPIVNAPAVTPSTGQYTEPAQITITVPDGYTAYYTMDGSTPDPGSSSTKKYTGPVDMPENTQTIFNAILVNDQNGKATEVTTRNYITTD
ncbi:MAG TPA: chitobiase/beta-hexosaminidase C-terminal domain-containing protein [Candidatus Mediterraneibacter surreyensis]|nr:chitobiase/beta-hexosaminidase C-terminal domain-containing protein [Candidatus Mediterraneibacter surreyensis]